MAVRRQRTPRKFKILFNSMRGDAASAEGCRIGDRCRLIGTWLGKDFSILLTPTRVEGVKRSSASVYVCVCVSVCPLDRTKTAETTITKLATGIVHRES